jgi:hypothetical protein
MLVLLGILLFAGSACAAPAAEPASEVSSPPAAEPAPETAPPSAAEPAPETAPAPAAEPAPETSVPAAEPAPEPSSPVAPVVETAQEVLAPVETVVESAPEVPVLAPVVESTPEILPPLEPVKEVNKEAPATEPIEEVKEASATESGKEAKEAPVAESIREAMQVTATAGQDAAPANNPAAAVGPEVSSAPNGPLTTTAPVISGESQTASATSSVYAAALARMIATQRAENFNRELGGLGSSLTDTAEGSRGPSLLSVSAALVEDLSGGTTSSTGAPAGSRSGGSPGGSSPSGPPPGSAPSGSFGGAAGGGSGIALAGFPTFAGHLLPGAPLAMRRLRLSFQPWLTAFFVLIPERPG